jgi:UPF0755 protein
MNEDKKPLESQPPPSSNSATSSQEANQDIAKVSPVKSQSVHPPDDPSQLPEDLLSEDLLSEDLLPEDLSTPKIPATRAPITFDDSPEVQAETDPDEVEEIRHLLAGIPTRTKTGTVLFTKESPITPSARSSKRLWRTLASAIIVITLGILGLFQYLRQQLSAVSLGISAPTEFEVQSGWGASRVAEELETSGFIRNARVFKFYLQRQKLDRNIGEGLYDLDPAMSAAEIATTLNQGGRPRVVKVIIPEGFRMKDIAKELSLAGFGTEQTLLDLFENPGDLGPHFLSDQPLEGYLFPASYEIPVKSTAQDILELFLKRFEQELTPQVKTMLAEKGWTIPAWVTLASMVQSEAANATEMPIITGVFLNRLDNDMLLQSDPTVAYGLGKDLPELDAPAGDFKQDHPWNTYTRTGLPQTPINNPGHDALQGVLNPQRNDESEQAYFYFLHGLDDGQPVFRPNLTLADHNRDVALYLR